MPSDLLTMPAEEAIREVERIAARFNDGSITGADRALYHLIKHRTALLALALEALRARAEKERKP